MAIDRWNGAGYRGIIAGGGRNRNARTDCAARKDGRNASTRGDHENQNGPASRTSRQSLNAGDAKRLGCYRNMLAASRLAPLKTPLAAPGEHAG